MVMRKRGLLFKNQTNWASFTVCASQRCQKYSRGPKYFEWKTQSHSLTLLVCSQVLMLEQRHRKEQTHDTAQEGALMRRYCNCLTPGITSGVRVPPNVCERFIALFSKHKTTTAPRCDPWPLMVEVKKMQSVCCLWCEGPWSNCVCVTWCPRSVCSH